VQSLGREWIPRACSAGAFASGRRRRTRRTRSEERRVGKECRYRGAAYDGKKNQEAARKLDLHEANAAILKLSKYIGLKREVAESQKVNEAHLDTTTVL